MRKGWKLKRSPRRDPDAIGYGLYALFDETYDVPLHCGLQSVSEPFALSLDDVEAWLKVPFNGPEYRTRRDAAEVGLILTRSLSINEGSNEFDLYALFDKETGISIRADESLTADIKHTLTLEDAEEIVNG